MSRSALKLALLLSLALNLGVVGAVGYRVSQYGWRAFPGATNGEASAADRLRLSAEQRRQWHEMEAGFVQELREGWQEIRSRRETMIREIFSDQPDAGRIEAERAAIAGLQAKHQQRVIEQLLKERTVLDPAQRSALAEMLLRQAPATSLEERLHSK
jgi:Spy/CpxP family protein refolding chaperone